MAEARCHYCTRPAQDECHACGRLYCPEHGEDVCLRCLSPEAATPSPIVYRGAVLALAVSSAIAIYLLVSPPESESSQDTPRPATPTQQLSPTATPTPPGGTQTPGQTAAAGATATPSTPGPGEPGGVHVVQQGDSLSGIAEQYGITLEELLAANPGMTVDSPILPGQEINIPGE